MQSSTGFVRRRGKGGLFGGQFGPVLAAAAQESMEASGSGQIFTKGFKPEPEHTQHARNKRARPVGVIRVAWIGAAYVRAKRAAASRRITFISKGILRL